MLIKMNNPVKLWHSISTTLPFNKLTPTSNKLLPLHLLFLVSWFQETVFLSLFLVPQSQPGQSGENWELSIIHTIHIHNNRQAFSFYMLLLGTTFQNSEPICVYSSPKARLLLQKSARKMKDCHHFYLVSRLQCSTSEWITSRCVNKAFNKLAW